MNRLGFLSVASASSLRRRHGIAVLVSLCAALGACGQKGPLKHPTTAQPASAASAPAR